MVRIKSPIFFLAIVAVLALGLAAPGAFAVPLPGGTLDPLTIPKYVTPLVIPPVMNSKNLGKDDPYKYKIAVRQFRQQILPGGIWKVLNPAILVDLPPTTLWSYGPDKDPLPDSSALGGGVGIAPAPNSQFNYPAYTFETMANMPVDVRWINDLKSDFGAGKECLPHLLPIDQTLHWANPPMDCRAGDSRTDCSGTNQDLYTGPVPIVTHVHGAHVDAHSDGYPEAWWLPNCNIPEGYATEGTTFDDAKGQKRGRNNGYADYSYRQDQPATTLWYHDHSLGMTRLNVYAGPAGFWLIRGGLNDGGTDFSTGFGAVLPGPAPVAGEDLATTNFPAALDGQREKYREIPIVIQDRSFNNDGSLYYPANRAFFEGLGNGQDPGVSGNIAAGLDIPFAPDSDVASIWNPEAFFNVMVVNGVSWPSLNVAQDRYRFRLLNGCNSRFLNLALVIQNGPLAGKEVPFYQIGAEQGFLPKVVRIQTGEAVQLRGNGFEPPANVDPDDPTALLMGLAERADVIVDFSGLRNGTVVRMINTAPDAPFGGFPDDPADPVTTGQVMQFVVDMTLNGVSLTDGMTTDPANLVLNAEGRLGPATNLTRRNVSLNELESESVFICVNEEDETVALPIVPAIECNDPEFQDLVPFGPTEALLGTVNNPGTAGATGNPLKWTDDTDLDNITKLVTLESGATLNVDVTENPELNSIEEWDIYNFTADAHPIHLHLVRFEVIGRTGIDGSASPNGNPQPWETGFKDTVVSYPGEITTVKALFDIEGLYVWHCHIVEHEDNEMMRPYVVGLPDA